MCALSLTGKDPSSPPALLRAFVNGLQIRQGEESAFLGNTTHGEPQRKKQNRHHPEETGILLPTSYSLAYMNLLEIFLTSSEKDRDSPRSKHQSGWCHYKPVGMCSTVKPLWWGKVNSWTKKRSRKRWTILFSFLSRIGQNFVLFDARIGCWTSTAGSSAPFLDGFCCWSRWPGGLTGQKQLSPHQEGQGRALTSSKHIVHSLPWTQRCFQLEQYKCCFCREARVSGCGYTRV